MFILKFGVDRESIKSKILINLTEIVLNKMTNEMPACLNIPRQTFLVAYLITALLKFNNRTQYN